MRKIRLLLLINCIFAQFAFSQTTAHPTRGGAGSWRYLGTVTASYNRDHDVINVAGPNDFFRSVKFKVSGAGLNMQKMVVFYDGGGAPENIEVRSNIPEGGESRVIDLRGGSRKLKSVQFWYDTKGWLKGTAKLTLFGLK